MILAVAGLAQASGASVLGLGALYGLLILTERRHAPAGRHSDVRGGRAVPDLLAVHGRRVVSSGSIDGILTAIRRTRQQAAERTYAYNVWAATPAGRLSRALTARAAASTEDGAS